MVADYWDLLRGDTSKWSSRPYFLALIRQSGEPVLDVACGTGRLLIDYAGEGIDIDGVDISPDMIDGARQNAARAGLNLNLYVQPMQKLNLPRRYRTIIVPSSSFLHLTERKEATAALNCFHAHLEAGGLLAMSMRIMDASEPEIDWEVDAEAARPEDDAVIRRWFRCTYDAKRRLQHTEDRYEILIDGMIVHSESYVSSPFLTWYPLGEALDMVAAAGFQNVIAHSDFKFKPATEQDTSYIVLGNKS
jgi:SAM-dependent methyltransferase